MNWVTNNVVLTRRTPSTFVVPALSKRSASATVELKDGQTIGIAGLINEDLREAVHKFPGLGSCRSSATCSAARTS